MKNRMYIGTAILFCLMSMCIAAVIIYDNEVFYALAITFGTFFYHFIMRLLVGGLVNAIKHNRFDYTRLWFQKKGFEDALYKKLRVKSWKIGVPTFEPELFNLKKHSIEEVIMATCQAEVVHEIIVVLSFIPILFSIKFDSILVFILTSLAAAALDMVFVILQRFNRPRLVRMIRK